MWNCSLPLCHLLVSYRTSLFLFSMIVLQILEGSHNVSLRHMSCKLVCVDQKRPLNISFGCPTYTKTNWEPTFRNGEISHKNLFLAFLEEKLENLVIQSSHF